MKGDFIRNTFDLLKHYSRVLMQQGRVRVDADWNEQNSIAGTQGMRKSRVVQMVEKGRCGFCEKQLKSDKEKTQGLCGRCYEIRRMVKRWESR